MDELAVVGYPALLVVLRRIAAIMGSLQRGAPITDEAVVAVLDALTAFLSMLSATKMVILER